ncbi:MAG: hypothetical protein E6K58_04530 [Nitrospirae bacterium]|nr:MAG: hypothetical protein E6K58_04530 [Nitrospirota bacterium]
MRQQHTISQSMTCSGVGLHTGQPVTLTLRPAPPETGIVFVRHEADGPMGQQQCAQPAQREIGCPRGRRRRRRRRSRPDGDLEQAGAARAGALGRAPWEGARLQLVEHVLGR